MLVMKKSTIVIIAIIVIIILAFSIHRLTGGAIFGGIRYGGIPEGCNDSDGGQDYFTKGVTLYQNREMAYVDICLRQDKLREHYCDRDRVKIKNVRCDDGCAEGACIKAED